MNKNLLKTILAKKHLFVPLLFTEKQLNIMQKYLLGKPLKNAEKKALYTSITKKADALSSLQQKDNEFYINGVVSIIPERIEEAKKLIEQYSDGYKKVFIAGSFLFTKDYNDIDIFIIAKKGYKEKFEENKHIIYLSEKRLSNSVIKAASLIAVSNFIILQKPGKKAEKNYEEKKPSLSELMSTYHEAVLEKIRDEKKSEAIRTLVFDYSLYCKKIILDGKQLSEKVRNINLEELDNMIKELLKNLFSETYLYVAVHTYIKTLQETVKNITPNIHLKRFINTYEELIYGSQRSKTATA